MILEKVTGPQGVRRIQSLVGAKKFPESAAKEILQLIETEILRLHDGNIARFKVKLSEFKEWKSLQ